jgi:hypothetical protein
VAHTVSRPRSGFETGYLRSCCCFETGAVCVSIDLDFELEPGPGLELGHHARQYRRDVIGWSEDEKELELYVDAQSTSNGAWGSCGSVELALCERFLVYSSLWDVQ